MMANPQILRDMTLFVEVAKRKSFSQAATVLDMPVSSLSRRIAQFEASIGLRLLDRTTRKVALTAYGETYLAQATRLVEEAQRSFDELVAQAKGPSGFLRIAAPTDFWAVRHLSEIAADFARQNEHVHVHLDLHAVPVDLVQENYDLAICTEAPREASLIVRKIGILENGLFASPDYLLARRRPGHPRDLAAHEIVLLSAAERVDVEFRRGEEAVSVSVGGSLSCNSLSLARRMAIAGYGIAASSLINVERDVKSGRLEAVLPDWRMPQTDIYVATTSRLVPAKVRSFIDHAAQHLSRAFAATAKVAEASPNRPASLLAG
jgi:DNA-binding transcriptional LysR family regulator